MDWRLQRNYRTLEGVQSKHRLNNYTVYGDRPDAGKCNKAHIDYPQIHIAWYPWLIFSIVASRLVPTGGGGRQWLFEDSITGIWIWSSLLLCTKGHSMMKGRSRTWADDHTVPYGVFIDFRAKPRLSLLSCRESTLASPASCTSDSIQLWDCDTRMPRGNYD